jgi:hypothetical protein
LKTIVAQIIILVFLSQIISGQDISYLHLKGNITSTLMNPGAPLNQKINVGIGSLFLQLGTNGPSVHQLTSVNNSGQRYLDINVINELDESRYDLHMDYDVRTVDLGIQVSDFTILAGHGFRSSFNINYTSDIIKLLSQGNANFIDQTLEIGPIIDVQAYNELYLGLQKTLGKFTLGAKAKLLYGTSSIYTETSDMSFRTLPEFYQLQFKNEYTLRSSNLLKYDGLDDIGFEYSRITFDNLFFNNQGFAVDLGATFKLNKNITLSASALDIGSIQWDFSPKKYTSLGTFTFEGIDLVDFIQDTNFNVQDTLLDLIEVNTTEEVYRTSLNNRFVLGGSYVKDNWAFHSLYQMHTRFGTRNHQLSLSAIRKINFFDIGLSYTLNKNNFNSLGIYLGLKTKHVNVYFSTQNIYGIFEPTKITNVSGALGFSFQL